METDKHIIAPGDVYEYKCDNNQGYGYMIPVKTSVGWDFIDTYHLDRPWAENGEIAVDASIRRINELGCGEHDGFVSKRAFFFCHQNVLYSAQEVPSDLRFVFNLNDYEPLPYRECSDYDTNDTIIFVPLYREQNFDWDSGITRGLCFVRKGAEKNKANEFQNLLNEARNLIIEASFLLEEIEKKLHELELRTLELYKIANDIKEFLKWHDDRPTPTCHIRETDSEYEDSVRCDRCQMTFNRPWNLFRYCPECGAKVVDTDD